MKLTKLLSSISSFALFSLQSGALQAAEYEEASSFSFWPLVLLAVVIGVFYKRLIAEATPEAVDLHDGHGHEAHEDVVLEKAKPAAPKAKPASKKSSKKVIDLTGDGTRCQGGTAKGTQCSRRTGLEAIEVEIDGQWYRVMTCKQHNTDPFKHFEGLIS